MADEPARPANLLEVDASIAEAVLRPAGEWVTIGGIVGAVRSVGAPGAAPTTLLTLADFHATIDVLAGGRVLGSYEPALDDIVLAGGRLRRSVRGVELVAQVVERFELRTG